MVDPIVSKSAVKPLASVPDQGSTGSPKLGESKFDKVRTRLQEEQAAQVNLPPTVKQVSLEQRKVLEADLFRRLAQTKPASAQHLFAPNMRDAKDAIRNLTNRVNALPQTSAFDPVRTRLETIDSQFQSVGKLLHSVQGTQNQADLMKLQVHMYQLSENLELMSKVVEQMTSGMKSILQTQV
jgi:hypothetical protein